MTPEMQAALAESAARIRAADEETHAAQVAFLAGKFDEYFRAKVDAIQKRLEQEYASLNPAPGVAAGGSDGAPVEGGAGAANGSESGGP
jgi:hypothetical protein